MVSTSPNRTQEHLQTNTQAPAQNHTSASTPLKITSTPAKHQLRAPGPAGTKTVCLSTTPDIYHITENLFGMNLTIAKSANFLQHIFGSFPGI